MKKSLIILAGMMMITAFAFGQAENNYRSRNHKLNPNYSKQIKETSFTIPAKKDISADVYSYLARNNKLSQGALQTSLELVTPAKDYHYRALNHKLRN